MSPIDTCRRLRTQAAGGPQGLLLSDNYQDEDGDHYFGYSLTEKGWGWVQANQGRFALRKARPQLADRPTPKASTGFDNMDDDIPF